METAYVLIVGFSYVVGLWYLTRWHRPATDRPRLELSLMLLTAPLWLPGVVVLFSLGAFLEVVCGATPAVRGDGDQPEDGRNGAHPGHGS